MTELSNSEYQILRYFYEFNQALTKHELLERLPKLNGNTTAAVIRKLLNKGYLEVGEIKFSQNVLARAYRPSIPFIEFIKDENGGLKKRVRNLKVFDPFFSRFMAPSVAQLVRIS
ncbi:BlaI/MecI/CopY family transcriptional regulator [Enterococcus casseliflavus]|uniref:BlaI/MecI/CopY family transcriptional regulator n=1 Tax=Enterococcus casseliflavus TaxID=37734 RepID=UPI0025437006|nr:BlaI/MecI/CopY family transcriptional regulator [Enterococcus casseliflavus]MDK4450917.1 MarR family transcriptional regulator [Enterococcus casseliflavus]